MTPNFVLQGMPLVDFKLNYGPYCKSRQVTPGVKLSLHLLATLGLIIVHSIYIWQLV